MPLCRFPAAPNAPGAQGACISTGSPVEGLDWVSRSAEVIMSLAGHVSRAMLSRYSHVRMEAKQHALDGIAARQRAADEKREEEAAQKQAVVVSQVAVVQ
jgi:membrane protein required for beta-lactamase induction